MIKDKKKEEKLEIIPLGGLGEVGRNMTLFQYKGKILVLDMGLGFPGEDMPGVDCTIPDVSYLKGKERNILGSIITHGHYDHIGAIPYILPKIGPVPIYTSPLTKGMILRRELDFPSQPHLNIKTINDGSKIKLGDFQIEFFRQNHNIPDNLGLVIKTPVGQIVHTADFKFDDHPVNELATNFEKLKRIGKSGVLLLMSDSTGAEEEGHSLQKKQSLKIWRKYLRRRREELLLLPLLLSSIGFNSLLLFQKNTAER
jgi:ribonuclease J